MKRRTGQVQQWVDSIPTGVDASSSTALREESLDNPEPNCLRDPTFSKENFDEKSDMTASVPTVVPDSPIITMTSAPGSVLPNRLVRDTSLQSDSSHCSSIESLLEWRKADPEAILLGLGFGGCPTSPQENGPLSRIPRRFLQPSKLKGIAISDFLKHQQETTESFDSVSLGYRGLTGSPHVAASEIVQKIMERLRGHDSHEADAYTAYNSSGEPYSPTQQDGKLSVLSPDNQKYLERPRSKSPDMRNKRMIIGQKSFTFSCDGDLIEIDASDSSTTKSPTILDNLDYNSNARESPHKKTRPIYDDNSDQNHSRRFEKLLVKQMSFDESTSSSEGYESTHLSSGLQDLVDCNFYNQRTKELQRISEERTDSEEQRDSLVTVISRHASDDRKQSTDDRKIIEIPRRFSDSSYDTKPRQKILLENDRRFSDGGMHSPLRKISKDSLSSDRRKSLRRQARISDVEAVQYCGPECLDIVGIEKIEEDVLQVDSETKKREDCSQESEAVEINRFGGSDERRPNVAVTFCDSEMRKGDEGSSRDEKESSPVEGELCCPEQRHRCCKNDELGQVCQHEESHEGCCYHANSTRCWRKILKKNKKLEDMVVKSRQEVAELRDMLSSVLSVRMEPGF